MFRRKLVWAVDRDGNRFRVTEEEAKRRGLKVLTRTQALRPRTKRSSDGAGG